MGKFWLMTCGIGACCWAALPGAPAQSVGVRVATPVAATPAAAASNSTPYDRLHDALRPRRLQNAAEVRAASTGALVDRVVEIKGTVKGVISRGARRSYIVQVDDTSINLPPGPDLANPGVLHPGANVRLLVQIEPNADSKDGLLSIIAATDQPDPNGDVPEVQVVNNDTSGAMLLGPGAEAPNPGAAPTTPRNGLIQPQAQAQLLPRTENRPAPRANAPAGSTEELIASQKPVYKALVRRYNKKLTEAQIDEIATAVLSAGLANNMDPRFLAAIIAVESDFDIYCLSGSGAMGLGQLMPFNLPEAGITNAWNPTQNVWGTARLLRGHLNDYRSRPNGTLLAVAAYNAGPGAVRRAGYQVPPGAQVQRYVWKVYYRYKEFAPDMFR